jgi:hypothetical protein
MIPSRSIAAKPVLLFAVCIALLLTAAAQQLHSSAYASAHRKIAWIGENGRLEHPSPRPTTLTAFEWNAYLGEGGVTLPEAVTDVRITSQPVFVQGDAEVDFDHLTGNRSRSNPLLVLFTGKHHVTAIAKAYAANGVATIHVQSITFDGVTVPRVLLEYFANKYLRPKFGNAVGMDSTFKLSNRMDSVVIGDDQVTITQR